MQQTNKPVSNLNSPSTFSGTDATDKVKSISKDIGNTVAGLKTQVMGAASTGAKAVRDGIAYVTDSVKAFEEGVSAFKSAALGDISSILKDLTSGWIDVDDITDLVKFENGKLTFDTDSLMGKISNSIGFDISSLENLKKDLANQLFNEFDSLTDGRFGGFCSLDGTKLTFREDYDAGLMGDLVSLLDRLDVNEYDGARDPNIDIAFNKILFEEVVRGGMIEAFAAVYDRLVKSSDEATGQSSIIEVMEYAIDNGDYYSLNELDIMLHPENLPRVKATYPKLGAEFLKNYRFGSDDYVGEYDVLSVKVKALLVKLNGKKFWNTETPFGEVLDLTVGGEMSDHAVTLFILDDELGVLVCANGMFYNESAIDVFQRDFSNVVMIN